MNKLLYVFLIVIAELILLAVMFSPAQSQIAPNRALEIQKSLKLHGHKIQMTGLMDSQTTEVLRSIAKSNGWQHKVVPDSRVLILIGLGTKYGKLLNPETAWKAETSSISSLTKKR